MYYYECIFFYIHVHCITYNSKINNSCSYVSCFVVRGCAVSRRYIIDVCNCDVFCVVNVYLDHMKFSVVCINGRMYVCCNECYIVTNRSGFAISALNTYTVGSRYS